MHLVESSPGGRQCLCLADAFGFKRCSLIKNRPGIWISGRFFKYHDFVWFELQCTSPQWRNPIYTLSLLN